MGSSDTSGADTDDVRVIVTGGEELNRCGVAWRLEKQDDIEVVVSADIREALSRVGRVEAQVAVVLYQDPSALELCRRLSIRRPPVGVVVADSFRSAQEFEPCREAGATAFVRTEASAAVVEAVRAVASGRQFRDPDIPDEPPNPYGLTARQREVLALLVERRTNPEIAEELHLSENTVKDHIGNIFEKLDVHSREAARDIAIREGLV